MILQALALSVCSRYDPLAMSIGIRRWAHLIVQTVTVQAGRWKRERRIFKAYSDSEFLNWISNWKAMISSTHRQFIQCHPGVRQREFVEICYFSIWKLNLVNWFRYLRGRHLSNRIRLWFSLQAHRPAEHLELGTRNSHCASISHSNVRRTPVEDASLAIDHAL